MTIGPMVPMHSSFSRTTFKAQEGSNVCACVCVCVGKPPNSVLIAKLSDHVEHLVPSIFVLAFLVSEILIAAWLRRFRTQRPVSGEKKEEEEEKGRKEERKHVKGEKERVVPLLAPVWRQPFPAALQFSAAVASGAALLRVARAKHAALWQCQAAVGAPDVEPGSAEWDALCHRPGPPQVD